MHDKIFLSEESVATYLCVFEIGFQTVDLLLQAVVLALTVVNQRLVNRGHGLEEGLPERPIVTRGRTKALLETLHLRRL